MDKLELTFPIFYHCAIKGACSLQQYNCVNVLLNGEPKSDSGISISESTASVYVNGAKPLPKDMIFDILHRPTAEIVRRLRELNFFDVTAIADSMERLLELVDVSAAAKNELLNMRRGEDPEYRFLSEVFRSALKNSPSTKRLIVEEKAQIHACRSSPGAMTCGAFSKMISLTGLAGSRLNLITLRPRHLLQIRDPVPRTCPCSMRKTAGNCFGSISTPPRHPCSREIFWISASINSRSGSPLSTWIRRISLPFSPMGARNMRSPLNAGARWMRSNDTSRIPAMFRKQYRS